LQATQKKIRNLSVEPGLRGSSDLRVGRKMENFQLFFQLDRAKDLSAPLIIYWHYLLFYTLISSKIFLKCLTPSKHALLPSSGNEAPNLVAPLDGAVLGHRVHWKHSNC